MIESLKSDRIKDLAYAVVASARQNTSQYKRIISVFVVVLARAARLRLEIGESDNRISRIGSNLERLVLVIELGPALGGRRSLDDGLRIESSNQIIESDHRITWKLPPAAQIICLAPFSSVTGVPLIISRRS